MGNWGERTITLNGNSGGNLQAYRVQKIIIKINLKVHSAISSLLNFEQQMPARN